jgi:hypothetical protein
VTIELDDGTTVASGPTTARGDPECPLGDDELLLKFRALACHVQEERRLRIEDAIFELDRANDALETLLDLVLESIDK